MGLSLLFEIGSPNLKIYSPFTQINRILLQYVLDVPLTLGVLQFTHFEKFCSRNSNINT